jgi:hypothetical protein
LICIKRLHDLRASNDLYRKNVHYARVGSRAWVSWPRAFPSVMEVGLDDFGCPEFDPADRVGVNIRRVKALSFVFIENRSVLFYVLSRILQKPERFLSPRAFGPRNHLQKLASRLGVSLRSSSEHRSK